MATSKLIVFALFACASSLNLRQGNGDEPAPVANCGKAPFYPNSKPLSYEDSRDTRYSDGNFQENTFVAGQSITYKCDNGFTVDASAAGNTTYEVTCADQGYFMPSGACLKASKCGALPEIAFASPTGKEGVAPGSIEFACQVGYSLDGEKVVAGGFGKNRFFPMRCQEFGGWEQFNGECKPYAFMPSGKAAAMYTKVFDTLFGVTCKSSMHKRFEEGTGLPETSTVCAGFDAATADCEQLVGQLKADFESEQAARQAWEAEQGADWHKNPSGRPDIDDEADAFCASIWRLMGH